jgi:hypothetical protein
MPTLRGLQTFVRAPVFVLILAWVWATDRPSPAYPHGRFTEILFIASVVLLVGYALGSFYLRRRL